VIAGAGDLNIFIMVAVLFAAAVVGDSTGYMLGKTIGVKAFDRPNSFIFNQKHLNRTKQFYEKHGGKTIIFARFVPIIRTFAPFVSGVAGMPYRKFISFSALGSLGWVGFLTFAGYFLGNVKFVQDNFEKVVLMIIVLSLTPPAIEAWREHKRNRNQASP
jgi:membrane-associated protein